MTTADTAASTIATVLHPADLVFTAGDHRLSRLIRWRTRAAVNHVAGVVGGGTPLTAMVLEALHPRVKQHTLVDGYGHRTDHIQIYRALNITDRDKAMIVRRALRYDGRRYGWSKVVLHTIGLGRVAWIDSMPICNWIWAAAYHEAGYHFGTTIDRSTPGTMYEYCRDRDDKYELVWQGYGSDLAVSPTATVTATTG